MRTHPGFKSLQLVSFIFGVCLSGFANADERLLSCCDDLEARLQAIEQTAARKSGPISLRLNGQVNRVLMVWDDGVESDAYIADNIYSSSRSTLSGEHRAAPGLKTGFVIEIEYREVGTSTLTAANDEGSAAINGDGLRTRLGYGWLESEGLGRLSAGQLSPATNSLVYYKLWSIIVHTSPDVLYNTAFAVRGGDGRETGLFWRDLASGLDSARGDFIQYVSPDLAGFRFWADWGENDVRDAALTYDGAFGDFLLSTAAGLYRDGEIADATDLRISALLRHKPSGLYLHSAYAERDFDARSRKTARLASIHAGIEAQFTGLGATTIFTEAARYNNINAGSGIAAPPGLAIAQDEALASSATIRLGAGVMQSFDDAGLETYVIYQHYEAEAGITAATMADTISFKPWQSLILGSRIKF